MEMRGFRGAGVLDERKSTQSTSQPISSNFRIFMSQLSERCRLKTSPTAEFRCNLLPCLAKGWWWSISKEASRRRITIVRAVAFVGSYQQSMHRSCDEEEQEDGNELWWGCIWWGWSWSRFLHLRRRRGNPAKLRKSQICERQNSEWSSLLASLKSIYNTSESFLGRSQCYHLHTLSPPSPCFPFLRGWECFVYSILMS